jgi:hypothetical protein
VMATARPRSFPVKRCFQPDSEGLKEHQIAVKVGDWLIIADDQTADDEPEPPAHTHTRSGRRRRHTRSGSGTVAKISGMAGMYVDQIRLQLRGGHPECAYGQSGGKEIPEQTIHEDEGLLEVEQIENGKYLGACFQFQTSSGRTFKVEGSQQPGKKWSRHAFKARAGYQISGLRFQGSELVSIEEVPFGASSSSGREPQCDVEKMKKRKANPDLAPRSLKTRPGAVEIPPPPCLGS